MNIFLRLNKVGKLQIYLVKDIAINKTPLVSPADECHGSAFMMVTNIFGFDSFLICFTMLSIDFLNLTCVLQSIHYK